MYYKNLKDKLMSKKATIAVIGLGYVGLPIALDFARQIKVVGFDIIERKLAHFLKRGLRMAFLAQYLKKKQNILSII